MRGTIRKRGTAWQAIVNVTDPTTGRRRQLTGTRRTKADAETLLVQLLAQAGRAHTAAATATMADLLAAWQAEHAEVWSPGNVRRTRELVDSYLVDRLGGLLVRKVRARDLEGAYRDLLAAGARGAKPLAPASVRRLHSILRSALEQAVRWEWIADNPAGKVDTRKVLAGASRPITPPAPADVIALLAAARAADPELAAWLQAAADTGARRGEVCALRWSDVDLDAGTVRIERSIAIGDELVEKTTKTGNRRKVALAPDTVDALRAHRRRAAERVLACGASLPADGYVWSFDVAGSTPWRPDLVTKRFGRLRAELGLERVRLHDLRHFVATTLLAGGVDLATVAGRLGHAGGGRTTLAVYAHMLEQSDRNAADLMARTLRANGG